MSAAEESQIAFEAFGVRALVGAGDPEIFERVRAILPPGWQPCPAAEVTRQFFLVEEPNGVYGLVKDQERFAGGFDLELALGVLDAQLRLYIASHAPDRIFVHAGVVGHQGRAIVIPGTSFSGKTTLVAALVRAGATYYSDEYAPLDDDGWVHPYPKPLSLRDADQVQHDRDVSSLGGIAGVEPLRIGAVVVTAYAPGATWRAQRLSQGEGVLALLSNTVVAQTRPEQAMRALSRCLDGAVVLQSPRGDASDLVPLLLAELGG